MYHFKTKQSPPAGNKPIPQVSAILYHPRLADSCSTQSGTQTDDDSSPAPLLMKSGSSRSILGAREQEDNTNNHYNSTDAALDNLKRSASGNLLFRRRKGSVDEQQRQESKSRARARDLYAEYEQAKDKDETLNPSKGNFKNSEAAITTMSPSLCSSIVTVKQAQALYHAKNTKQQKISGESREPMQQQKKKKSKDELLSKTTPVKKEMSVEISNIRSGTSSGHQAGTQMTCVSSGVLLENNPDGVLMVQSNRSSYGKKYKTPYSRSAQGIEKALAVRRKLNSNNSMVVVEKNADNDGVECVFPISLACYSMTSSLTTSTEEEDVCFNSPKTPGDHDMNTTMRQLPEIC